uniref:Alpha-2-macroglobulin-like n=1 Tax=Sphaeramia orbicularis TaxID=375764 RepID=A0A673C6R7_9TELE
MSPNFLFFCFYTLSLYLVEYMVPIPAILEAGTQAKFCASLLQPNESLTMTVTLRSKEMSTTLLQKMSEDEFHTCAEFVVPSVTEDEVQDFEVEVRGNTFYSKEVRKVKIIVRKPVTFIQTDKPLYLPGQTVHFRVVTLDSHLKPNCQKYDKIELEDSNNNLIGQWLNDTSDRTILQLSYELNTEAKEGVYTIMLAYGQEKKYHNFKVEKYVLPKFEVKINTSEEVSIDQDQITAKICAEYTYKQPVPGNMKVDICRPLQRYFYGYSNQDLEGQQVTAPCHKEIMETDNEGCVTMSIPMSTFIKLDKKVLQDVLEVTAKMQEEGTGIEHSQNQRIMISYVVGKVSFIDTPKIYEKGSNFEGKVQALDGNKVPIPDMPVYLFEGETWSSRHLQNLTTDKNGVTTFTVDTSMYSGDIHLHVSAEPSLRYPNYREPHFENGDITLSMAQESSLDTKTVSFLRVKKVEGPLKCHTDVTFSIQYTVVKEAQSSMDVMYLVSTFVLSSLSPFINGVCFLANEGEVTFNLHVDPELAPEFHIVAYAILSSGFVIAHEAEFSTEKCFGHKVLLDFSPSSAVPGEEITLQVTGHPQSMCGISAVDKSVLIKEPGKTLDADRIFDLLDRKWHVPYDAVDEVECISVRPKRYIIPYQPEGDDPHTVFQNVGLKMATNLFIRVPNCLKFMGRKYYQGHNYGPPMIARMDTVQLVNAVSPGLGGAPAPPIETARSFFPETWIWDLVEVGVSGTQDMSLTAPDTITTWETEAFCLSPQGFGLAPRKEFSIFQPFFLELSLPYSIIRGEHFELKATVFNYMTSCFTVTVTPDQSSDYTLTPLSGNQYSFCLCGKERRTVSWTMVPSALGVVNVTVTAEASGSDTSCSNDVVPERGRIDTVTKSLIVKAEGVEKTDTYNWLLCPKGESLTEEVNVNLQKDVIDGSARASVSVLGDILGRALKNLDGMLQMPYGCGEQNMAKLAPNIYILQYLKNTNQLTPEIQERATNYLTSGYQRQLNYKHSDGAYSTFGTGDGNTWLTAFVLRSFAKAQSFIFIDPSVMEQSKTWLEGKQRENGCFQQVGKLFNNRMRGGVSDDVTLSAYITAAMLERNVSPVLSNSLSCLKASMRDLTNTYTTALMAYVFTLAGDTEARTLLLGHLDKVGVSQGGFLHWSQTAEDTSASLSVEISSYVLLAKLSASPSTEDLGYAAKIVRWLTTQQNYYGGFSSTQDTVVALQALALYSTLVFSPEGSSTVTIQAPSTELTFDVNQNNKLLYQERLLQDVEGKYSVEVKGTACAVIQLSTHYNIPTPRGDKILSVELQTAANCDGNSLRPKMTLKMKSLYSGKQPTTNMVILDIKVLSGFSIDAESLKMLRGTPLVDRVEQKQDHVLVYLEELPKDLDIHHEVVLVQEFPVSNLKPAVVRIYDYYQPKDKTEYTYPCV